MTDGKADPAHRPWLRAKPGVGVSFSWINEERNTLGQRPCQNLGQTTHQSRPRQWWLGGLRVSSRARRLTAGVRLPVMACRCIHVRVVIRNEKAGSTTPCHLTQVTTVLDNTVEEKSGRGHARRPGGVMVGCREMLDYSQSSGTLLCHAQRPGVAKVRQSGCLMTPCQTTPVIGCA